MVPFKKTGKMSGIERLFDLERRKLAEKYNHKKRINKKIAFFFEIVFWFVFLGFSFGSKYYVYLDKLVVNKEVKILIYLSGFYLLYNLFSIVIAYFFSYILDYQYELSNQSRKDWIIDEIKAFILGLILFYFAARIYLFLTVKSPELWWIYYTIIASIIVSLLTFILPVVLLPIFYNLESYPESELKEHLLALINKTDVEIDDIYQINLSSKINAANAAVIGLGSSRKIVLSDNLKDKYSIDEIKAILAHELGHQVHRDIIKNLLIEQLMFLIIAYLIVCIQPLIYPWFGYNSISDPITIPLLVVMVGFLIWLLSPIEMYISRSFEKRADLYAVKLTTKGDSLIKSLVKMADEALLPLKVNTYERIFLSHPPISARVEYIFDNSKKE